MRVCGLGPLNFPGGAVASVKHKRNMIGFIGKQVWRPGSSGQAGVAAATICNCRPEWRLRLQVAGIAGRCGGYDCNPGLRLVLHAGVAAATAGQGGCNRLQLQAGVAAATVCNCRPGWRLQLSATPWEANMHSCVQHQNAKDNCI